MKKFLILAAAVSLIISVFVIGCGGAEEEGPTKILLVHSYHAEYPWVADITQGFKDRLEKKLLVEGEDYELEFFYMDTNRKPEVESMKKAGNDAVTKIEEYGAEIVITADDNAQEYVSKQLLDKEGVSVIFCGVNSDPIEKYRTINSLEKPGHNITGVLERERVEGTIGILHDIDESLVTFALVYDDSTTIPPVIERIKALGPELGIEMVYEKSTGDFEEWKTSITEAEEAKADFLYISRYHTLKTAEGEYVDPADVIAWTFENSNIPMVGVWNWSVEGGALCAESISGIATGAEAADLTIKVMNGVEPAGIPISVNIDGDRMVSKKAIEKFGYEMGEGLEASVQMMK